MAFETDCKTCTGPGNTILTVSLPGGLDLEVLGVDIEVCPICIRVFTDGTGQLTDAQRAAVNAVLQTIRSLIPNI